MGYVCDKHNRIGLGENDSCSDCTKESLAKSKGLRVTLGLGLSRSRRGQNDNKPKVVENNQPPQRVPPLPPSTQVYATAEQWNKGITLLQEAKKPFAEMKQYFESLEQKLLNQQRQLELDQSLTNEQRADISKRLVDANMKLGALRLQEENKLKTDRGDEERLVSTMRNDQENNREIEQRNRNAQQNNQESIQQKQERERLRSEFKSQALKRRKEKEVGTNQVGVLIRTSETKLKNSLVSTDQTTSQLLEAAWQTYNDENLGIMMRGDLEVTDKGELMFKMLSEANRMGQCANSFLDKPMPIKDEAYGELEEYMKLAKEYATEYKNAHGKVLFTSKGRARMKECEKVLKLVESIEKQLKERKELYQARSVQAIEIANGVLDSVTKSTVTPGMVRQLEDLLRVTGLSDEARSQIELVIQAARSKMQRLAEQEWAKSEQLGDQERAEILLEFGDCKPPGAKGQSDSFFIKGSNGQNAFLFKPIEGEARSSDLWIEGGGAPREILATSISEMFEQDLGINLNMPRSVPFSTEDESFVQGSKSKSKTRTGALQNAIQFKPGDPVDVKSFASTHQQTVEQRQAQFYAFDPKDTESIALLDFITLNSDRHAENMLLQDPSLEPGKTRLVPIDAGLTLPTKNAFRLGASTSMTGNKFDPENKMQINSAGNFLMQLPDAQLPFSESSKEAIEKIDPDKFVEKVRLQYQKLGNEIPEMAGKVSEDSFDLMKRSILFLKKAAKANLTKFQISQVYAIGFIAIMDAAEQNIEREIDKAINIVQEYDQLGGPAHASLRIPELAEVVPDLSMEERLELMKMQPTEALEKVYRDLQGKLTDIEQYILFDQKGPFKLGTQLTEEFSTKNLTFLQQANSYKRAGGDPRLRSLLEADPATYELEVKVGLGSKGKKLMGAIELVSFGGYAKMKELMGEERFNREILGKPTAKQYIAYNKFLESQK